jgi:hypothetical protein
MQRWGNYRKELNIKMSFSQLAPGTIISESDIATSGTPAGTEQTSFVIQNTEPAAQEGYVQQGARDGFIIWRF